MRRAKCDGVSHMLFFIFRLHCSPCYPPQAEVKPLVFLVGFEWEDVFIPLEV